jgi:hypothetical protein
VAVQLGMGRKKIGTVKVEVISNFATFATIISLVPNQRKGIKGFVEEG